MKKNLKIRYPRLAKIDMKNATKLNHAANIFTQKWSKKRITPQACFTNTRLKNNNFTASHTKIDSITCHDQTFNHDITHKNALNSRFHVKNDPKNVSRKNIGGGGRVSGASAFLLCPGGFGGKAHRGTKRTFDAKFWLPCKVRRAGKTRHQN